MYVKSVNVVMRDAEDDLPAALFRGLGCLATY